MSELRITSTNSANDAKGRAFGLEGNDFVIVLVALIAAIALYIVFSYIFRVRAMVAFGLALPVLLGPTLWVVLLRHNRPEGYAEDLFEDVVNGEGWSLAPVAQPRKATKEPNAV